MRNGDQSSALTMAASAAVYGVVTRRTRTNLPDVDGGQGRPFLVLSSCPRLVAPRSWSTPFVTVLHGRLV
jgi:hypothetical protein